MGLLSYSPKRSAALLSAGCAEETGYNLHIGSFSPSLAALGPILQLLARSREGGFEPPSLMRCQAPLILSTKLENVFTAVWLTGHYYRFQFHEAELQTSIQIENGFDGISSALRFRGPLYRPL